MRKQQLACSKGACSRAQYSFSPSRGCNGCISAAAGLQAAEGKTIAGIAAKLALNGFYAPPDLRNAHYGDR